MNIQNRDFRMDRQAFFKWLEGQEGRFELVEGRPFMLPYVSRHHALISSNVVVCLSDRIDRQRYNVFQGDFAIETGDASIRYADVMVEPFGSDGSAHSTNNALLLVEVLSPSTMHVDFHDKLQEYLGLPSLQAYMICAQDAARVWLWARGSEGWPAEPLIIESAEANVEIAALSLSIPMREIFRGVSL